MANKKKSGKKKGNKKTGAAPMATGAFFAEEAHSFRAYSETGGDSGSFAESRFATGPGDSVPDPAQYRWSRGGIAGDTS